MANIWNSDDRNWKVEVYENGNKTGEMTREKSLDAWGAGYHVGVLSANPDSHGKTTYDHFYHYKLKDAKAAVEIRATDCFGKVYAERLHHGRRNGLSDGGQLSCDRRITGQVILRIFILG